MAEVPINLQDRNGYRRKFPGTIDQNSWNGNCTKVLGYISQGLGVSDIATKLHVCRATIYNVTNSEYFKAKLDAIKGKALEKVVEKSADNVAEAALLAKAKDVLTNAAQEAADRIVIIAKRGKPEDRIQLDACRDILDRVNVKGKDTIVSEIRHYSPEEIESAKKTLLEVESITARVTTSQSRFILPNQPPKSQDDIQRPIEASPPRPETLPE